jgi:hypothetical protein
MGLAGTLRAACGIAGPAAFTAAWLVGTRHQPTYSVANEHISGLAAADATQPGIMTAGFVALGASTVVFASELHRRLGGDDDAGPGPVLLGAAGLGILAAGVFRRDRISNFPMPGQDDRPQSWANDVHDLSAIASGGFGLAALIALAGRFAADPAWRPLAPVAAAAALTSGGLSAWFVRDVVRPGNGFVQRVSVTIPLGFMVRVAAELLRRPRRVS